MRNLIWLYVHENEADEGYKLYAAKVLMKGTSAGNYNRFYF